MSELANNGRESDDEIQDGREIGNCRETSLLLPHRLTTRRARQFAPCRMVPRRPWRDGETAGRCECRQRGGRGGGGGRGRGAGGAGGARGRRGGRGARRPI